MSSINYDKLFEKIIKKAKVRIPFKENEHNFTKIAFDVYQLNNSPVESLWVLESDADDGEILVAMYDDQDYSELLKEASVWKTYGDSKRENITLSYKNMPICKFSAKEYGFDSSTAHIFQRSLLKKLANKEFVYKLLKAQPKNKQIDIINQFPELIG